MHRRVSIGLFWVALASVAMAAPAVRAKVRVAVGAVDGSGGGRRAIIAFQKALRRAGIAVQTTSGYRKEVKAQGVEARVPGDASALGAVGAALGVDAIVYVKIRRPDPRPRRRSRRKDRELYIVVYGGGDGAVLGEHTVRVPKGRLTRALWRRAVRVIGPDVERGSREPPDATEPPIIVETRFEPERPPRREDRVDAGRGAWGEPERGDEAPVGGPEIARLRAGMVFFSRTFRYSTAADSPILVEGIDYDAVLAPGFAVGAEVFPMADLAGGVAANVGIRVDLQYVVFESRQEVTGASGTSKRSLDTTYYQGAIGVLYRHRFGGAEGPAVGIDAGLGVLGFDLEQNPEYRGSSYTYLELGLGGEVPIAGPLAVAEARLRLIPLAGSGDSAAELGGDVSGSGYGVALGVTSHFGWDLQAHVGLDYLSLASEVSGAGRGGRIGKSVQDSFLGIRALGGYAF